MALVDFFIATPLDEEWRDLRDALGAPLKEHQPENSRTWYLGRCSSERGEYLIASASMAASTGGQANAATFTSELLREWRPASIILVGIAGSFNSSWHALGDVIVPEQVFGYELGSQDETRIGRRKTTTTRTLRPTGHQTNFVLLDRARALRNNKTQYEAWQGQCFESSEAEAIRIALTNAARKRMKPPELHFDILASGNDVIRSSSFARRLRKEIHPNLAGVEMEAKGVFTALHSSDSGAHFLMVRGVSDHADKWKRGIDELGGVYRRYAAANAARFVRSFLARGPQRPLGPRVIPHLELAESPLRAVELGVFVQAGMSVFSIPSLLELRDETPPMKVELEGSYGGSRVAPREYRFVLHRRDTATHLTASGPGTLDLPAQEEPARLEAVLSFDGTIDLLTLRTHDAFGADNEWKRGV